MGKYFRKHVRVSTYNYSENGAYFVTLNSNFKQPIFRKYRSVVEEVFRSLPNRFHGVSIDTLVVMDNHIHIILFFSDVGVALGQVVGAGKSLTTKALRDIGFKERVWQINYFEHIIRTEKTLNRIRRYIANNPRKEEIDATIFFQDEPLGE